MLKLGVCCKEVEMFKKANKTFAIFIGFFVKSDSMFFRTHLGIEVTAYDKKVVHWDS